MHNDNCLQRLLCHMNSSMYIIDYPVFADVDTEIYPQIAPEHRKRGIDLDSFPPRQNGRHFTDDIFEMHLPERKIWHFDQTFTEICS